jgi:uncharacterized heparinase superfamily protein
LANAKALVFAGLFFGGGEGNALLRKGIGLLERQASEQILADGGHFELSPTYHALVLEDLLDVSNLLVLYSEDELHLNRVLSHRWYPRLSAMRQWLLQRRGIWNCPVAA